MKTSAFFASLAAVGLIEGALRFFRLPSFPASLAVLGLARCLEAATLLAIVHASGAGVGAVGLSRQATGRGIRQGFLWSAGFGGLAGLGGTVLFLAGINPLTLVHVGLPQTRFGMVLFFVVGGVIAPVAEELFFRGVIYGYLRNSLFANLKGWGVAPALFISTALFVMAHQAGAGIPLPQLVGGVVFCLAYEKEKSLLAPILIHSLGNLALFTLSSV